MYRAIGPDCRNGGLGYPRLRYRVGVRLDVRWDAADVGRRGGAREEAMAAG
ncbi:hypothetical protein I545_4997 [Mycobacterium kansasii 662]|uniref:Uncharacterized protein n=2 Tax=Mycobacterium kansasii TaxID=1768 RepID=A0A1V3X9E2_MYCKA|nr:hypothetical protein I547_2696 [Mycobacterium kansasii 824]EUA12504.1 hypothetical protein I545_4997 [Mycobacterium kansasii 662]KEP38990.1 hypothetical protein MKSMC1_59750 [Mycobacterium kansasii]OOK75376.1 hypothetical protein BZL30_3963 [Mycobacterium kansasii]